MKTYCAFWFFCCCDAAEFLFIFLHILLQRSDDAFHMAWTYDNPCCYSARGDATMRKSMTNSSFVCVTNMLFAYAPPCNCWGKLTLISFCPLGIYTSPSVLPLQQQKAWQNKTLLSFVLVLQIGTASYGGRAIRRVGGLSSCWKDRLGCHQEKKPSIASLKEKAQ